MTRYRAVDGGFTWRVEQARGRAPFELLVDGYATEADALRHILVAARLEKQAEAAIPPHRAGPLAPVLPFGAPAHRPAAALSRP